MEDYKIVDLYWQRSEDAIKETDAKYGRMLKGISLSFVEVIEDAEECLNDTYLAAWQSMPSERPVYLGAFLSRIIRSLSIDRYRARHSKKRGGVAALCEELTDCIPDTMSVETEYDNSRLADTLNRFVESLDEERRYIFIRRYYYSDAIDTIADKLGSGVGRIKTILHRLRKELKKILEEGGIAI